MDSSRHVRDLFNAVAPWYDAMNRRMSLGLDRHWRRRAVQALSCRNGQRILDVATGTADLACAAVQQGASCVVGIDFSAEMLSLGQRKVAHTGLSEQIMLLQGDTLKLPFPARTFDAIINAFVLRNLGDLGPAFAEMARVVRPGGQLICLEITYPKFPPWRALFRLYFHRVVPLMGRWLTHVAPAYRYLPDSLARFPPPEEVIAVLGETGWQVGPSYRLFPGTAMVYTASPLLPPEIERT